MKNEKRLEYINIRKHINDKEEKSKRITSKILSHPRFINSSTIGLYASLEDEVSTDILITESLRLGKRVYLPKVVGEDICFYEINSLDELMIGTFGVREPISNNNLSDLDLVIVPGVIFDSNNNRMGYGKGYYDRFLKDKKCYKIGICFKEQITDNLPIDDYDIKMDEVVVD